MAVAQSWLGVSEADLAPADGVRALVKVTPKAPAFYPPIKGALALAETPVGLEPMMAEHVAPLWTAEPDPAYIGEDAEYGNAENDRAALRQHLAAAMEWGGGAELAVLVVIDGIPTTLRITGTEAAIRQALPDAATVAAWKAAGVTEFPMQLEPGHGQLRRITWVPIDRVPTILQLERAWRGDVDA